MRHLFHSAIAAVFLTAAPVFAENPDGPVGTLILDSYFLPIVGSITDPSGTEHSGFDLGIAARFPIANTFTLSAIFATSQDHWTYEDEVVDTTYSVGFSARLFIPMTSRSRAALSPRRESAPADPPTPSKVGY